MAEFERTKEGLKKIQVVLHLEPELPKETREMEQQSFDEIKRDILNLEDVTVVRKLGEGIKPLLDRPEVIAWRSDNVDCNLDIDYDISKPSSSKQILREVIQVDEFEESEDWIDIPKQKHEKGLINSLRETLKILNKNDTPHNKSRISRKRYRSRSSSKNKYGKRYRSSSNYSNKRNDRFYDTSEDRSTTSSISSEENNSDHGYNSKKTNKYYNKNSYKRKNNSTPFNISNASTKKSFRSSRYKSYSKKYNRRSRYKAMPEEDYNSYLHDVYRGNKMYMSYLKTNIVSQATQLLLAILNNMSSNTLE